MILCLEYTLFGSYSAHESLHGGHFLTYAFAFADQINPIDIP